MFRRAKISVLSTFVGVLTASGALLNPEQRHPAFQPGAAASLPTAVVLKPGSATAPIRLWSGIKVQPITPSKPAAIKVGMSGIDFARAGDAVVAPGLVKQAGGAR